RACLPSGAEIAFQAVILAGVPAAHEGDRYILVPGLPLDDEAGTAGVEFEMRRDRSVDGPGGDAMLRLGPGHVREQPLSRTDELERLTGDARCRLDVDHPLLELERFSVRQM